MTDHQAVEKVIEEVVKDFGKLDVFVANAGAGTDKGLLEMPLEDYHKLVDVNSKSSQSLTIDHFH